MFWGVGWGLCNRPPSKQIMHTGQRRGVREDVDTGAQDLGVWVAPSVPFLLY